MMAHVILKFDVKFENEGVRPENVEVFIETYPTIADVSFKKRQT